MKRLVPWLVVLIVLLGFGWTLFFLWQKSQQRPVVFETVVPTVRDITEKTVAAGAIVPRREVAIKPRVSGIIRELRVAPGQQVEAGDLLALIRIIPNVVSVNAAEARVAAAKINARVAETEKLRLERLHEQQLVGAAEYNKSVLDDELSREELRAAKNNLVLVREGAVRGAGTSSNQVTATLAGTVLEVPVEVGGSVIESNNFNEGTTIATIADMGDLVFKGQVDESEVGRLVPQMPVTIRVGAIQGKTFSGRLEYIAPKGVEVEGTIEFEVRAKVDIQSGTLLRANYSANADVILDARQQVLTLPEGVVSFEKEDTFVDVEVAPQRFERRQIKLGLSDGINAEVLSGVTAADRVKVPTPTREP